MYQREHIIETYMDDKPIDICILYTVKTITDGIDAYGELGELKFYKTTGLCIDLDQVWLGDKELKPPFNLPKSVEITRAEMISDVFNKEGL